MIELLPSGLNLYSQVSDAHTKYQNQLQFIALEGLDVAPQVVSQVFVVVAGARDHARIRVVVEGGGAQAAEVVVGVGHDLGFTATYPRGDLADVARFLCGGCGQARDAGEGLVVVG